MEDPIEHDEQIEEFIPAKKSVFKKLHINIPLVDVLFQTPSYAKFLNDKLSNKRKLGDHETVMLIEECNAIIQKKLPPKLKDPGSFTVPYTISEVYFDRALCDLGTSINLMSLSVFKKLGLGEANATTVTLQLVDTSLTHPRGIIEDMLVKVEKFIFLVNFLILDMEGDKDIPLILGRPFFETGRALIDIQNGQLILRLEEEQISFNVFKAMKLPTETDSCFQIDAIDKLPPHPRYAYLEESCILPVIISKTVSEVEEEKLLRVLRENKTAIGWTIADIKGISPSPCMHKILMEENFRPTIEI
ncbi:uncharacterized protein LOC111408447 [Olea europaea var. sylvestris]|uniref:uncharacterized protein LOC111408447 n=1 Tax=Olea europaea var. sylvestris TaxID=158386 RepID=UPI000C1CE8D6|nr:uncharacterized protein LOC111408447 [Olea europaea var. sylvestris]